MNECARNECGGGAVLEVGAIPSKLSLLNMKCLKNATEKIGINLDGPYKYNDFKIIKGNANDMKIFKDETFDTVLCSAVLEHDKFFWKTISEIKRVTKRGGIIVIGVPGYADLSIERFIRKILPTGKYQKKNAVYQKIPFIGRYLGSLYQSTVTFKLHDYPGDYYRFSPQTVREVFFEGMKNVDIRILMVPPRIIASGIKP